MTYIEHEVEIISNTDKPISDGYTEADIADLAAGWLLDKGYPVGYTDKYSLSQEFLRKNYGLSD